MLFCLWKYFCSNEPKCFSFVVQATSRMTWKVKKHIPRAYFDYIPNIWVVYVIKLSFIETRCITTSLSSITIGLICIILFTQITDEYITILCAFSCNYSQCMVVLMICSTRYEVTGVIYGYRMTENRNGNYLVNWEPIISILITYVKFYIIFSCVVRILVNIIIPFELKNYESIFVGTTLIRSAVFINKLIEVNLIISNAPIWSSGVASSIYRL